MSAQYTTLSNFAASYKQQVFDSPIFTAAEDDKKSEIEKAFVSLEVQTKSIGEKLVGNKGNELANIQQIGSAFESFGESLANLTQAYGGAVGDAGALLGNIARDMKGALQHSEAFLESVKARFDQMSEAEKANWRDEYQSVDSMVKSMQKAATQAENMISASKNLAVGEKPSKEGALFGNYDRDKIETPKPPVAAVNPTFGAGGVVPKYLSMDGNPENVPSSPSNPPINTVGDVILLPTVAGLLRDDVHSKNLYFGQHLDSLAELKEAYVKNEMKSTPNAVYTTEQDEKTPEQIKAEIKYNNSNLSLDAYYKYSTQEEQDKHIKQLIKSIEAQNPNRANLNNANNSTSTTAANNTNDANSNGAQSSEANAGQARALSLAAPNAGVEKSASAMLEKQLQNLKQVFLVAQTNAGISASDAEKNYNEVATGIKQLSPALAMGEAVNKTNELTSQNVAHQQKLELAANESRQASLEPKQKSSGLFFDTSLVMAAIASGNKLIPENSEKLSAANANALVYATIAPASTGAPEKQPARSPVQQGGGSLMG